MREKIIEQKLALAVKALGGIPVKIMTCNINGMPDRLILLPCGRVAFAELKAPGKPLRPLQLRRKHQIEALGFRVFVIDHPDQIGGVLDGIQTS